MNLITRRILFWIAVIIFGGTSWIAVRYAQGYKYDFSADRFVRTGAISVTANTDAKLFVDDQLIGSLSLFSHTASKDKLSPGTYSVHVDRAGYSTWRKDVVVQEGLLTQFPSVMLLPTDEDSQLQLRVEASRSFANAHTIADATPTPKPTPLPKGVKATPEGLAVSSSGWTLRGTDLVRFDLIASGSVVARDVLGFEAIDNQVMWYTRNGVWALWVRPTNDQPFRAQGEQELVGRWSVPIRHAAWFRDNAHIVVDLGNSGYRVIETDTRGGTNVVRF